MDSEGDSSSRRPIPDICVIHLDDTFITGEVKTKNVVGLGEKNPLAPAQMVHDRTGPERGMKFIPPRSVNDTTEKMASVATFLRRLSALFLALGANGGWRERLCLSLVHRHDDLRLPTGRHSISLTSVHRQIAGASRYGLLAHGSYSP